MIVQAPTATAGATLVLATEVDLRTSTTLSARRTKDFTRVACVSIASELRGLPKWETSGPRSEFSTRILHLTMSKRHRIAPRPPLCLPTRRKTRGFYGIVVQRRFNPSQGSSCRLELHAIPTSNRSATEAP